MRTLTILVAALGVSGAQAAEIGWQPNYNAALREAKASKRVLMLDFYTDW